MPATAASRVVVSGPADGLPSRVVRRAVTHVLSRERRKASVAVTFLGKRGMQRLNASYLRHDRPTDVISFALPQPDGTLAGDIYVCRYVAARHARLHHLGVREELVRIVVHGTLHLLGWDHPDGPRRTRSEMWRRQERYVTELS